MASLNLGRARPSAAARRHRPTAGRLDGYLVATPYSRTCLPHVAPAWLDHVAVQAGFAPPRERPGDPFGYCDLGCGQGLTTCLLAAAAPGGRFLGLDAMPEHVSQARAFAKAHDIGNAHFRRDTFERALRRDDGPFDYIVCHGVYSWVSDAQRRHLAAFLGRFLRPGGLCYLSYNALPGSNSMMPIQQLLLATARAHPELSPSRQIERGVALLAALSDGRARGLGGNPAAERFLESVGRDGSAYLVHEYLNESWRPVAGADVVATMVAAGLTWLGSARLVENRDDFLLRSDQRRLLRALKDPRLRDLVRAQIIDQAFRADVYGREPRRLSAAARRTRRLASVVAPTLPPARWTFSTRTPAGRLSFDCAAAHAVAEGLADGPRPLGELMRGRERAITVADLLDAADALLASGQCLPADPRAPGDRTARANLTLRREALGPQGVEFQVSPFGALIRVPLPRLLLLGAGGSRAALEQSVLSRLAAEGCGLASLFSSASDRRRPKTALRETIRVYLAQDRAFYRALGIQV